MFLWYGWRFYFFLRLWLFFLKQIQLTTFAIKPLKKAITRRDRGRNARECSLQWLIEEPASGAGISALSFSAHVWAVWISALFLAIAGWTVSGLCPWAETLVKTSNLIETPSKHIPGIPTQNEEKTFKKLIFRSSRRPVPCQFQVEFDWILSEYFSSFWERTFLSVQLQLPGSTWGLFENAGVRCYGNSSRVRLPQEDLSRVLKNILFPSAWFKETQKPSLSE